MRRSRMDGCRVFVEGRFVGFVKDGECARAVPSENSDARARFTRTPALPTSRQSRREESTEFTSPQTREEFCVRLSSVKTVGLCLSPEMIKQVEGGSAQLERSCSDGRYRTDRRKRRGKLVDCDRLWTH